MRNLFHYEYEWHPGSELSKILKKWDVVQNKHLLDEALDEYFRSRMVMRPNRKKENAPSPIWRLTIPLWALAFLLIAFVVLPVQWMLTGEYKISHKSKAFTWLRAWNQKLFQWPKN